jgi:hypothetical protein
VRRKIERAKIDRGKKKRISVDASNICPESMLLHQGNESI